MFERKPTIYTNITFMDTLMDPTLKSIPESKLEKLEELINSCDLDTDDGMYDAVRYAEKMAIFHGVPGLIRYVDLQIHMMTEKFEQDEEISGQCVNTLGYLKLARMIDAAEGGKFKADDPNYWQTREKSLARFGDVLTYQNEAEKIAISMFNTHNTPTKTI